MSESINIMPDNINQKSKSSAEAMLINTPADKGAYTPLHAPSVVSDMGESVNTYHPSSQSVCTDNGYLQENNITSVHTQHETLNQSFNTNKHVHNANDNNTVNGSETALSTSEAARPMLAERFKTKMCKNYILTGACPYTNHCMFAHGEGELRTYEDNVRDGLTTESAIKAFHHQIATRERMITRLYGQNNNITITVAPAGNTTYAMPANTPSMSIVNQQSCHQQQQQQQKSQQCTCGCCCNANTVHDVVTHVDNNVANNQFQYAEEFPLEPYEHHYATSTNNGIVYNNDNNFISTNDNNNYHYNNYNSSSNNYEYCNYDGYEYNFSNNMDNATFINNNNGQVNYFPENYAQNIAEVIQEPMQYSQKQFSNHTYVHNPYTTNLLMTPDYNHDDIFTSNCYHNDLTCNKQENESNMLTCQSQSLTHDKYFPETEMRPLIPNAIVADAPTHLPTKHTNKSRITASENEKLKARSVSYVCDERSSVVVAKRKLTKKAKAVSTCCAPCMIESDAEEHSKQVMVLEP